MKKPYARITKQIGFSYLINAALFLISPLLILLLTRTLSVAEYGIYSILAITVSVAGVLLDLGLSQYVVSQLAGVPARQRTRAFTSLLGGLIIVLIAVLGVVLLTPLSTILPEILKLTDYAAAFRVALAIILCVTLIRVFVAYFTAQTHLITANVIFLLSQGLWVLLLLGAYAWTRQLTIFSVMVWWFAGVLLTLAYCSWRVRREFTHFESVRSWGSQLWTALLFSIPLLAFTIGSWTIEIGDRYMLNAMLGSEAVGLYTLIYSLLGVVATLGTVISQTFFPYLAAAWNKRANYQVYLNAMLKYSLMMVIPAMAGFLALREPLVTLISGEAYLESANIIPGLLLYPLLAAINFILYQVVLLRKRTMLIGATYCAGAAINIVLNAMLIPRFAMTGAAIATVASYAFVSAVLFWNSRKAVRLRWGFLKIGRIAAAAALMGIAAWWAQPEQALTKIATVLAGALAYFALLFAFRVFSQEEKELLRGVLPAPLRRLVPGLSGTVRGS